MAQSGLDGLKILLSQGGRDSARLSGLERQQAIADKLRNTPSSAPNRYGYGSGLSALASVVAQSAGRQRTRDLAPQLQSAEEGVNAGKTGLTMYREQAAQDAADRKQANFDSSAQATADYRAQQQGNVEYGQRQHNRDTTNALKRSALVLSMRRAQELDDQQNAAENKRLNDIDSVELINDAGDDTKITNFSQGGYTDPDTDAPSETEGWRIKPKITRGSGSLNQVISKTDAFGNVLSKTFDKSTGGFGPTTFFDGSPYSEKEAKRRGGLKAGQKGAEQSAKTDAKLGEERIYEITKDSYANAKTLEALDQSVSALENGAWSGPIVSAIPSYRSESIKLDNAKARLGLEEIGRYTMGSLSEAEGAWLRDSAIPNLPEDELLPYMQHRREATIRMMEASAYEREVLQAGGEVNLEFINEILRGDGFDMSEQGYKK